MTYRDSDTSSGSKGKRERREGKTSSTQGGRGEEMKDRKGGRGRSGFVSQEDDGGGEREPDVQETEEKQVRRKTHEKRWKYTMKL